MPIRCFAIDDEPLALEMIRSYIERTPFLRLSGCFSNALEAAAAMHARPVDLLFLDIQMPGWTGLQLASSMDAFATKIIFTTAFDRYALDGFKAGAIDYLLKPVCYEDFLKAAQKAQRYIDTPVHRPQGSLTVRAGHRWRNINHSDILYIEAMRDYVAIHTEAGETIRTLNTLQNIAAMLPGALFVKVQRSFIVHLHKIQIIERRCILFGKTRVPISTHCLKGLMQRLR
ncbi:MAG: LytTR family DNA-binding domain-containing protein [Prevotellaceae bacterium]|jgi:DNA-binding LytR/AlgR family response regulator|nr:LytTR family DNA-binding domain-containing protein [Prevotellaceae bacterium]